MTHNTPAQEDTSALRNVFAIPISAPPPIWQAHGPSGDSACFTTVIDGVHWTLSLATGDDNTPRGSWSATGTKPDQPAAELTGHLDLPAGPLNPANPTALLEPLAEVLRAAASRTPAGSTTTA